VRVFSREVFTGPLPSNTRYTSYTAANSDLLDLAFAHFFDIHVSKSQTDLAIPLNCHPSWHNGQGLLHAASLQVPILFRNFACGDYTVLFQMLSPNNEFCVYDQSSADPSYY
jgi:hypothetical protein